MRRSLIGPALSLVLACVQPTLAEDFHPLTSQDLAGGVYEFDNILIPEGVTLTLVGEPQQLTLRALEDLTLAGSLVAPGWEIRLEAGDKLQVLGSIDVGNGSLNATTFVDRPVTSPPVIPSEGRFQGTLISLAPGGDLALLNTRVTANNSRLGLAASGAIAMQGIVQASSLRASAVTILGWQDFDIAAGGSLSFTASPGVTDLLLVGRDLEPGYLRIASGQVLLRSDGGIEIAGIRVLEPTGFLTVPERLVIEPGLPVPEPETWAMLLAGLGLVGWRRRRTPA